MFLTPRIKRDFFSYFHTKSIYRARIVIKPCDKLSVWKQLHFLSSHRKKEQKEWRWEKHKENPWKIIEIYVENLLSLMSGHLFGNIFAE